MIEMNALLMAWIIGAGSCPADSLLATLTALTANTDGHIGVAMKLIETAQLVTVRGAEHFPMQSVYKLPIAMAVMQRLDRGEFRLDQLVRVDSTDIAPVHSPIREQYPVGGISLTIRDLLRAAIVESDGTASDVLLRLVPAGAVMAYVRGLDIDGLSIVTTEKAMAQNEMVQYQNSATPLSAIGLLEALYQGQGLSASSRQLLLAWLIETPTGPRRLRGLLPPGTVVAHKTGTDQTREGLTRATNDLGLITLPDGRHLAVAVFVADSRADEKAREGVIASVAAAGWRCYMLATTP